VRKPPGAEESESQAFFSIIKVIVFALSVVGA